MHSRQRDENRSQERMRMVIVDDLSTFDDTNGGSCLRGSPPTRIGGTDRDGI